MYIVIKKDKADHFKKKIESMKEVLCDFIECLEEARQYSGHSSRYDDDEEYERERRSGYDRARKDNRNYDREDDDEGSYDTRHMSPRYAMRRRY